MKTVLLDEEVDVQKKGPPDPQGSQYCVVDYINDPYGVYVAQTLSYMCAKREPAFAQALDRALAGEEEESPLRVYAIHPYINVHPNAQWVVLNYSRHHPSRVAMRMYPLKAKDDHPGLTLRMEWALKEVENDYAAYEARTNAPQKKKRKKAKSSY